MTDCTWRELVQDETSPLFTGEELAAETMQTLVAEANSGGVAIDSLSMVELGMIFEDSEKARLSVRAAAGSCACDGSGCRVVAAVADIANDPSKY